MYKRQRKGVLPEIVDLFGYSDDDITAMDEGDMGYDDQPTEERTKSDVAEEPEEQHQEVTKPSAPSTQSTRDEDDIDSFFG